MRLHPLLFALALIVPSVPSVGRCAEADSAPSRPGPGPGRYEIQPAAASIRIPFELIEGELRVAGRMNGQELRMLIDNGALWDQLLFFGSERVDSLGIERQGQAEVGGAGSGGSVQADYATGLAIAVAGLEGRTIVFHDQEAIIMPYEPGAPNPWSVAEGQFSAQFFKHFVVEFDFDAGLMTLTEPAAFDPAGRGLAVPIAPLPDSGSWTLPVAITLHDGRRLELDVTMDLGWDEGLGVTTGGAHAVEPPPGLERVPLGSGAAGPIFGYRGTVPALEIGGFRLEDLEATYASRADGGSGVDEFLVGLGALGRFNLVFDYPGHRLFLKPRLAP